MRCGIRPLRVLIVSATVGAGDAGNAQELARRLADEGHEAEVRDFLESPPLGIGKALSKGYEAELRHAPWAYELAFKMWFWLPFLLSPLARFVTFFTRKKILSWVREIHPDVVVSTYPVATQVLGELRRRAHRRWRPYSGLRVPAVNFITDFGFHPFWAHRGIDLNVAVPPGTVEAVGRRTRRMSVSCGPLVSPQFSVAPERRSFERAQLGLDRDELAILISSGSWGVGALRETFELVANQPGLVPVVTCGRNSRAPRSPRSGGKSQRLPCPFVRLDRRYGGCDGGLRRAGGKCRRADVFRSYEGRAALGDLPPHSGPWAQQRHRHVGGWRQLAGAQ